jgi:hypothetical protein
VQVEIASHVVSRYSISATWGPLEITSLVIPQNMDNMYQLVLYQFELVEERLNFEVLKGSNE